MTPSPRPATKDASPARANPNAGATMSAPELIAAISRNGWARGIQQDRGPQFRVPWRLTPDAPDAELVAAGNRSATTTSMDISRLSMPELSRLIRLYHAGAINDDDGQWLADTMATLPRRIHAGIDIDTGRGTLDEIEDAVQHLTQTLAAEWTARGFGTLRLDRSSGAGGGAHLVPATTAAAHPHILAALGSLLAEIVADLDLPSSRTVSRDKTQRPPAWVDLAATNKHPDSKGGMWRLVGSTKPGKPPKAPWCLQTWEPDDDPMPPHNTARLEQELINRAIAIHDQEAANTAAQTRIRVKRRTIAAMRPEPVNEQDQRLLDALPQLADELRRAAGNSDDTSRRDWSFGRLYLRLVADPDPEQLARLLLALTGGKAAGGRRGDYLARTISNLISQHQRGTIASEPFRRPKATGPSASKILDALQNNGLIDLATTCGACGRRHGLIKRIEMNAETGQERERMRSCQSRMLCIHCAGLAAWSDAERIRDAEGVTEWTLLAFRVAATDHVAAIRAAHTLRSALVAAGRGCPIARLTPYARAKLRHNNTSTAEIHILIGHIGDHDTAAKRIRRRASSLNAEALPIATMTPNTAYAYVNELLAGVGQWAADPNLVADVLRLAHRSQVFRANNQLRDILPPSWLEARRDERQGDQLGAWELVRYRVEGDDIATSPIDIAAPVMLEYFRLHDRSQQTFHPSAPVELVYRGRTLTRTDAEQFFRSLHEELAERWPVNYGAFARAGP